MLMMPTRLFLFVLNLATMVFLVRVLCIGHNFDRKPLGGCRKKVVFFVVRWFCQFMLWFGGIRLSTRDIDFDYSAYLGPNYKKDLRRSPITSTIVSNHVTWMDSIIMARVFSPSFTPKIELKSAPLLGTLGMCLNNIWMPRGRSDEAKKAALDAIMERQEIVEQDETFAPILVFAEGGVTNNTGIITFKKGPFYAEKTIKPIFMKFDLKAFSPAFNMPLLPLIFMQLSRGCITCKINIMPDFQPNEFLFETHKNSGEHEDGRENERWETFAWAVR